MRGDDRTSRPPAATERGMQLTRLDKPDPVYTYAILA